MNSIKVKELRTLGLIFKPLVSTINSNLETTLHHDFRVLKNEKFTIHSVVSGQKVALAQVGLSRLDSDIKSTRLGLRFAVSVTKKCTHKL